MIGFGGLLNDSDRVTMRSLQERQNQASVINSNIANAETPGYRAIGYDFRRQLADATEQKPAVRTSHSSHLRAPDVKNDGSFQAEVFVRPTESIPEDGNTVDVDKEMAELSENQIMYRAAVEILNRKLGMLRYAISSGTR